MCWACLKRGLIRVFVFAGVYMYTPKKSKTRKIDAKKSPSAEGLVCGVRSKLSVLPAWRVSKFGDTCAVRGLIRLDRTAKIYTVRGRKKHKVPRICIVYHFSETDQFLCDILETARNFNKKSPHFWGFFLRYQNSQTWDDVMCYNCERYL